MRVSPFRNPWIKGYLLLPMAFRSLSRLSSALSAKASTLRSYLLDFPCRIALRLFCLIKAFIAFVFLLNLFLGCLDINYIYYQSLYEVFKVRPAGIFASHQDLRLPKAPDHWQLQFFL